MPAASAASSTAPRTDWIVVRNRLSMIGSRNKQLVADGLNELSLRLGFRAIDGFAERVVYREFFPRGLTALDDLDEATLGTRPNMGHVTAREEVTQPAAPAEAAARRARPSPCGQPRRVVQPGRQAARDPRHPGRLRTSGNKLLSGQSAFRGLWARWRLVPGENARARVIPFIRPLFYRTFTQVLNRSLMSGVQCWRRLTEISNGTLHNNRVHRTMIRRQSHNIWSSCHVGVTYTGSYADRRGLASEFGQLSRGRI